VIEKDASRKRDKAFRILNLVASYFFAVLCVLCHILSTRKMQMMVLVVSQCLMICGNSIRSDSAASCSFFLKNNKNITKIPSVCSF
jgi:hypothetical protein